MNSKTTAGESYWSCYRRARKRSEFDLQLLSEHRRLDDSSTREMESGKSDGEASESIDNYPETVGATADVASSHNKVDVCVIVTSLLAKYCRQKMPTVIARSKVTQMLHHVLTVTALISQV